MADFRSALVRGGLGVQAAQDYDEQQAGRAHLQRARQYGVKVMESEERRRTAADTLLDKDTAIKQLRQDIERNELAFQKGTQGSEQAQRRADIEHRRRLQPGQQRLETIQQGVATGAAEVAQKLQPGQTRIAAGTQNLQLQTLHEQQRANVWNLYSLGDTQGALAEINKSDLIQPGRKFSAIHRGGDGKPGGEEMLRLVAGDGGEDVFVPVKQLQANAQKHGVRYEKVGNSYIRINPDGTVTPVYESESTMVVPEGATVVKRRTGQPVAAGGISPSDQPGVSPPPAPGSRIAGRMDQRMTRGKSIVDRYMGTDEFTPLKAESQPKYAKMIGLMGQKVRAGMNPEAAAIAAINEVEHTEAALAAAGRPGGAAAYSGPTPWRR